MEPRNVPALKMHLLVTAWDFTLPKKWHFRNIISWHDEWASKLYGAAWTQWLETRFVDFLIARRINVTSMYGDEPYATPDRMVALGRRGQNVFVLAAVPPRTRLTPEAERAVT